MSVTRPVKGGLFPLKPRRKFAKSPAYKSPAKTTDREEIPQPKDYRSLAVEEREIPPEQSIYVWKNYPSVL